jgi:hypothetical protein
MPFAKKTDAKGLGSSNRPSATKKARKQRAKAGSQDKSVWEGIKENLDRWVLSEEGSALEQNVLRTRNAVEECVREAFRNLDPKSTPKFSADFIGAECLLLMLMVSYSCITPRLPLCSWSTFLIELSTRRVRWRRNAQQLQLV